MQSSTLSVLWALNCHHGSVVRQAPQQQSMSSHKCFQPCVGARACLRAPPCAHAYSPASAPALGHASCFCPPVAPSFAPACAPVFGPAPALALALASAPALAPAIHLAFAHALAPAFAPAFNPSISMHIYVIQGGAVIARSPAAACQLMGPWPRLSIPRLILFPRSAWPYMYIYIYT